MTTLDSLRGVMSPAQAMPPISIAPGSRRMKRMLRRSLIWDVLPYPKSQQASRVSEEVPQPAEFGLLTAGSRPQENLRSSA